MIRPVPKNFLRLLSGILGAALLLCSCENREAKEMLASMQFGSTSAITTSSITPAIARLGRYGNPKQKAKALYYIGTAYFNEKDISNAMMAYTEAFPLDEEGDPYFSAMLHYGISAVYHLSHSTTAFLRYIISRTITKKPSKTPSSHTNTIQTRTKPRRKTSSFST